MNAASSMEGHHRLALHGTKSSDDKTPLLDRQLQLDYQGMIKADVGGTKLKCPQSIVCVSLRGWFSISLGFHSSV